MKIKNIKANIAVVLLIITLCGLFGCSMTAVNVEEEVIGTWTCAYDYEGNSYIKYIFLEEDGTYFRATYKNGGLLSTDEGDYEVEGRKVKLYDSDSVTYHGSWTNFKYIGGKLKSGDSSYTKEK